MDWFENFKRQQEQYQKIFEQYQKLAGIGSPMYELQRSIEKHRRQYDSLLRRMDLGGELARTYSGATPAVESFKALAFSPAFVEAEAALERTAAQYQAVAGRLKTPAWLEMTSGIERLLGSTLEELRTTVPGDVLEAARARVPASPSEPTIVAFDEWLSRIVNFYRWAAQNLPATRKVLVGLLKIARFIGIAIVVAAIQHPVSERMGAEKARKQARIERDRQAVIEKRFAEIGLALESLAAREQFTAVVLQAALVRLEPNSQGKHGGRLEKGTRVKVLSGKGSWSEIEYGEGDVAWVFGKHLQRTDEQATPPREN